MIEDDPTDLDKLVKITACCNCSLSLYHIHFRVGDVSIVSVLSAEESGGSREGRIQNCKEGRKIKDFQNFSMINKEMENGKLSSI